MALDEAVLTPRAGADGISGPALEALARSWLATEAVIERLSHIINPEVLQSIVRHNLTIDLSSEDKARASGETDCCPYFCRDAHRAQVRRHPGTLDSAVSSACTTAT